MNIRPRRFRKNQNIRDLVEEHRVTNNDLIYPVFIKEGNTGNEEISTMPGIKRHSLESLLYEIDDAMKLGIKAIALFPVIDINLKTSDAKEAYNSEGLTQRAIREIKTRYPELILISDVALDPYTNHGHDGLIYDGKIINDKTVEILCQMALVQAEAGADIVAPSDMMDGRVAAIRNVLIKNNFQDTMIMSYTAKYCSSLYSPFRDALGSLQEEKILNHNQQKQEKPYSSAVVLEKLPDRTIPQDKKTYQMNFANSREAIKEADLDSTESADILMVKPAGWYGDIITKYKARYNQPIAAYQVSGEYAMIKASARAGIIDETKAMQESLTAIKRAGADLILSYFAKDFLSN